MSGIKDSIYYLTVNTHFHNCKGIQAKPATNSSAGHYHSNHDWPLLITNQATSCSFCQALGLFSSSLCFLLLLIKHFTPELNRPPSAATRRGHRPQPVSSDYPSIVCLDYSDCVNHILVMYSLNVAFVLMRFVSVLILFKNLRV